MISSIFPAPYLFTRACTRTRRINSLYIIQYCYIEFFISNFFYSEWRCASLRTNIFPVTDPPSSLHEIHIFRGECLRRCRCNPFLFITGISCPSSVQTSLTQHCLELTIPWFPYILLPLRGASKIKLKKVNKTRSGTVGRVIIFLNISRCPLLICLHCCLHQYKTLKAVVTAKAAIILLTPAKNLNKVFWGFLVVSPLFHHYQGYV